MQPPPKVREKISDSGNLGSMILTFEVTNYRSFGDPTDLILSKRTLKTNHPQDGDWASVTHRATGVFGANASGKSNLVTALTDLSIVASSSLGDDTALKNLWAPHRLAVDKDVAFFVDFVVSSIRYRWSLSLNSKGVSNESVYVNDRRQWKYVFERNGDEITFGPSSGIPQAARSFINEGSSSWFSSVPAWMRTKNSGAFAEGFEWFGRQVRSMTPTGIYARPTSNWTTNLVSAKHWLNAANSLIKFADVGVDTLTVRESEVPAERKEFMKAFARFLSETTSEKEPELDFPDSEKHLELNHSGPNDTSFELTFEEESLGTRTWIDTAVPALYMIRTGGVLIIDEIDSSLHPLLVRELVGLFTDPAINETGAQLIFTSHDTTLLGNYPSPVIDLEAAWLTAKTNSYSEIYAIDEFALGKTSNPEKRYMQGALGAVPQLPRNLLHDVVAELREFERHEQSTKQIGSVDAEK